MGKKVNPLLFRLGKNKSHTFRWFTDKKNPEYLKDAVTIENYIRKNFTDRFISNIEIERIADQVKVIVYSIKPGEIIGRGRVVVNKLADDLSKKVKAKISIEVEQISRPDQDARLIANSIATMLEKRTGYRYGIKRIAGMALRSGAKGVKVTVSGRLGGREIASSVTERFGKVPLHTVRANIDYQHSCSFTKYGVCGVKVWIYKGEIFNKRVVNHYEQ